MEIQGSFKVWNDYRFHSRYYLSLTLKSYKTKESFAASNRDKRILEKEIPDLIEKCKYKQTVIDDSFN